MKIILASQSPRRKELLTAMGLEFETEPSNLAEYLDHERRPSIVAQELAIGKASVVAKRHPGALIIASDSIVTLNGIQLGKPDTKEDAEHMLRSMAGRSQIVTSSAVVLYPSKDLMLCGASETIVHFRPYNPVAVETYLAAGDYADKAGGYGIQSGAAPLIDHIEGDYDVIVGLPTRLLAAFLNQCGIETHKVELAVPVKQVLLTE